MGQLQVLKMGWSRLDDIIDKMGSDGLLSHIIWKLSEGIHPGEIAGEFDMPWVVLKKWIESDPSRVKGFELGRRALADKLAWDGIDEARNSDIETVALGKYRSDTYFKGAAVHNRKEYGNKTEVEVVQTHVVDIRELLAQREARLDALVGDRVGMVVPDRVVPDVVVIEAEVSNAE